MKQSALRIDVGGKLLTNLLMETISHKDFNLQGEFTLVNDMKEKTCLVATDHDKFCELMETCDKFHNRVNPHLREYVLPDYKKIKTGYVKPKEEELDNASIVNLTFERFQIPEVLFSPSDIGINEGGVAEMVK